MSKLNNFKIKTIREIKIWAWIAAVLPMTALAGLFFIWMFGTKDLFDWAMVVGQTLLFTVAVIWWWWAIYVIRKLVQQWETTRINVSSVLEEIRTVRSYFRENFKPGNDK